MHRLLMCGKRWETTSNAWPVMVKKHFFSGSFGCKLDEKARFVLPQEMRYGLVENGELEFCLALGLGGCLTIYKKSDTTKPVLKAEITGCCLDRHSGRPVQIENSILAAL